MFRNDPKSTSAPSIMRSDALLDATRNKLNQFELQGENGNAKDSEQNSKKTKSLKYKPFRSTALVLRDVKNSIELRMKARHESKSFAKLTNELATPPTKLYSPFNIYTPGCSGGKGAPSVIGAGKTKELTKSARRNKLNKKRELANKQALDNSLSIASMNDSGLDCSAGRSSTSTTVSTSSAGSVRDSDQQSMTAQSGTPKDRIALRLKKHLMQANTFASFASPTGRLRETVKDVEQFQQCIEDISMAIRARGESN